jgi:hypothetical protein
MAVVHVEVVLEVVAPVDHRDVDLPSNTMPEVYAACIAAAFPSVRGAGVAPPSGLRFTAVSNAAFV